MTDTCSGVKEVDVTACNNETVLRTVSTRARATLVPVSTNKQPYIEQFSWLDGTRSTQLDGTRSFECCLQHWSPFGPHDYLFDDLSHLGVHRPPHIFEVVEWSVIVSERISRVLEQSRVRLTSEQILENSYADTERKGFQQKKKFTWLALDISLQAVYSGFSQENKYK